MKKNETIKKKITINKDQSNIIQNPELIQYIQQLAKEMASSLKYSKKESLETALEDILGDYNRKEEVREKSILEIDINTNPLVQKSENNVTNYTSRTIDNTNNYPQKKTQNNFYERKLEQKAKQQRNLEELKNKKRFEEKKKFQG